jgi:hypothetical protein
MTVKDFQRIFNSERFDVKGVKVKVCLSSGERLDVVGVKLVEDRGEVELTVSGAEQPETPGE